MPQRDFLFSFFLLFFFNNRLPQHLCYPSFPFLVPDDVPSRGCSYYVPNVYHFPGASSAQSDTLSSSFGKGWRFLCLGAGPPHYWMMEGGRAVVRIYLVVAAAAVAVAARPEEAGVLTVARTQSAEAGSLGREQKHLAAERS